LLLNEQNSNSFSQIFRKYWQELYDFAYVKTQDKDVAEEIVQELFIHLWEKRQELTIRNLRSYFFISVKNRVIDHYRRTTFDRLDSIPDLASTTTYPLFLEELEVAIEEAIAQLPEKSRLVFNLKRFENQTPGKYHNNFLCPKERSNTTTHRLPACSKYCSKPFFLFFLSRTHLVFFKEKMGNY
jgi:RNA polymerase sigma-70 factor (ECF subfamily)